MVCLICGRLLKNQRSKELGYGPVCYRKTVGKVSGQGKGKFGKRMDDIPYYDIPGQMTLDDYLQTED